MTEPRRFLMDPGASSFERDLLESWSAEQPAPAARARALALGGIAASGAAFAGVTGTAVAPKAMSLAGMAVVKWGILGMLVASAATATVVSMRTSTEAPVVATTTAALAPPVPSPAQPTEIAPAPSTQESVGTVAAADLPVAKPTAAVRAAAPAADSLTEEIAAFDGVRAAETSSDADRTLALATAYERRYPNGTFLQEAEVLRIEALAKKGDREAASHAGKQFLTAHPQSPHAGRIRAIVDASTP